MKPKITLILLACLLLSGCASYTLPPVQAEYMEYNRRDPFGGTNIKAENVKVTDKQVTADTASWVTTYPSVSVSLTVRGYKRKISPAQAKEAVTTTSN